MFCQQSVKTLLETIIQQRCEMVGGKTPRHSWTVLQMGHIFFRLCTVKSWWWGQSHVKQTIGKDIPENSTEHKQGVDTEEDPEQCLLLQFLLIVV